MNQFLEKFNLPRLKQEEVEIMYKPIRSIKIKTVIKNLPQKKKKKSQGQTASQINSIKHLERS